MSEGTLTEQGEADSSGPVLLLRIPEVAIAAGVAVDLAIMASQALFGTPYLGHGIAMVLVLPLVASVAWSPLALIFVIQRKLRGRAVSRWEWIALLINLAGLFLWSVVAE